jgi:ribosomal-protein-alanine N-acetyltransferase
MSHQMPNFETSRLILRPIVIEYLADYEKHFVDYEVISHLSSVVPWPYPKGGVSDYFEKVILPSQGKDRWAYGIFLKENLNELIGCVDLWRKGTPENRGFWLGQEFWGRGFMTEAVRPVMDYAFNTLGFERLVFSNALGNNRSRRVKEKTGARLIATRPAKFVNPALTEAETWELTKAEWEKHKANE